MVREVLTAYPVQMCHFHPKLEASQELKYSDENRFTKALVYKSFLDEITIHPDSQKTYRSIRNNLPIKIKFSP